MERSSSVIYEEFLSRQNFELAFYRIKHGTNQSYKYFYKPDIKAFELFLGSNIEQLIDEIKSGKYSPQKACMYYIPKKNFLSRPIALLNFIDLIVYQAIANVIMYEVVEDFAISDNRIVFGNIINRDKDSSFFFQFKIWKQQWKSYKKAIESHYNQGYKYIAEFDIASFYDFIDHSILTNILHNIGMDDSLIQLLQKCLKCWALYSNTGLVSEGRCGIPQGPECSGFFAELYLREIDKRIAKNINDIKYLRYVDDMKIMAKDEQTCQKAIALLDYYCKDMYLIAQSGKISITTFDNRGLHSYLNNSGLKLSNITIEYRQEGKLKESTHNKLKKKLLSAFQPDNALFMDKTVLKYAFYKLNKDDEVKKAIIENWEDLYLTLEGPIYYLNKHYCSDADVLDKIHTALLNDDVLFQYNKAVIFDKFKFLPFFEDVFDSLRKAQSDRFWITKYFAIQWLMRLKANSLVKFLIPKDPNYFITREKFDVELLLETTELGKRMLAKQYYAQDDMLSIYSFYKHPLYEKFSEDDASDYVLNILKIDRSDYIGVFLKNQFKINKSRSKKLISELRKNRDTYNEAINDVVNFLEYRNSNLADRALEFLDLWHNIIVDIILNKCDGNFGSKIEQLKDDFPASYRSFKLIHDRRSDSTGTHYKNKFSQVRKMINKDELKILLDKACLTDAYMEICDYFSN